MIERIKKAIAKKKEERKLYDSIYQEEYSKKRSAFIIEKAKKDAERKARPLEPKLMIERGLSKTGHIVDRIRTEANSTKVRRKERTPKVRRVRVRRIKVRDVRPKPKEDSAFGTPIWKQ